MSKIEITAPCPWCGEFHAEELAVMVDSFDVMDKTYTAYSVSCANCGSGGPRDSDRDKAVEQWNQGPKGLSALVKTSSDLVDGVEEIEGWWCPSCGGETVCTFIGTCESCGYPIEDNQPDMEKLQAVKKALSELKISTDER